MDARQIAMNFWVGPVARAVHQREVLAGIPSAVGVHRLAPVLEAAAEVVAAGERAARAAQHDDLDRRVAFGQTDGRLDLVGHRRNDGVELVGPVQRDGRDGRFRLVQQGFELVACPAVSPSAGERGHGFGDRRLTGDQVETLACGAGSSSTATRPPRRPRGECFRVRWIRRSPRGHCPRHR